MDLNLFRPFIKKICLLIAFQQNLSSGESQFQPGDIQYTEVLFIYLYFVEPVVHLTGRECHLGDNNYCLRQLEFLGKQQVKK
jgi:hypothetical protein